MQITSMHVTLDQGHRASAVREGRFVQAEKEIKRSPYGSRRQENGKTIDVSCSMKIDSPLSDA